MTNWKYKINLIPIFKKYHSRRIDKLSINEVGRLTAEKIDNFIKRNNIPLKSYLKALSKDFKRVKREESYDRLLNSLYNFADSYKIWIETF